MIKKYDKVITPDVCLSQIEDMIENRLIHLVIDLREPSISQDDAKYVVKALQELGNVHKLDIIYSKKQAKKLIEKEAILDNDLMRLYLKTVRQYYYHYHNESHKHPINIL